MNRLKIVQQHQTNSVLTSVNVILCGSVLNVISLMAGKGMTRLPFYPSSHSMS